MAQKGAGAIQWRVKVYILDAAGNWMDKGTGYICVEFIESQEAMGVIVMAEEGNQKNVALLVHKIVNKDQFYRKSSESTIIQWADPELDTDVALSFQESTGCEQIWGQIKQVQHEMARLDGPRPGQRGLDEYEQHSERVEFAEVDGDLPAPELGNLEEIAKILSHSSIFHRDRVASALMKPNYITQLLDCFKQSEDLDDTPSLQSMYRIVKGAIMLNDAAVLEEMLKEEHVLDVVGALEYDPDLSVQQKHREFLRSCVQFKEVVPITDPGILAKIHQTYRIQYLKDVILPRSLDDATYATLSSLALFNNVEVVQALQHDERFLPELFRRLQEHQEADAQWGDLVAFLQEFCSLARHLQQAQRGALFSKLEQLGMFDVVTRIMRVSNDTVKLRATDILMSFMQHDTGALRTFLRQQPGHTLFSLLIKEFGEGSNDSGLPEQVGELLKELLNPETMETSVEKNDFVELFYDKYLGQLIDVINTDRSINKDGTREVPACTLGLIVDLLCFCVQHHAYRIKYYALRNHMLEKVLKIVRRREKWLVCAGIRFLRTCVAIKDDFFARYVVKNNVFEPIMAVFLDNGDRYNLLNSAVLELVEFIRREKVKDLMKYLVDNYGHRFDDIQYVRTFTSLKQTYEQAQGYAASQQGSGFDSGPPGSSDASGSGGVRGRTYVFNTAGGPLGGLQRRRRDARGLDEDEESYFESEDNEADSDGGGLEGEEEPLEGPRYAPGRRGSGGSADFQPGGLGAAAVGPQRGAREVAARQRWQPLVASPSGAPGAAGSGTTTSTGWLGLTDYDDEEEDAGAQQQQRAGGGTPTTSNSSGSGGQPGEPGSSERGANGGTPPDRASAQQQREGDTPGSDMRKRWKVNAGDSPARSPGRPAGGGTD